MSTIERMNGYNGPSSDKYDQTKTIISLALSSNIVVVDVALLEDLLCRLGIIIEQND